MGILGIIIGIAILLILPLEVVLVAVAIFLIFKFWYVALGLLAVAVVGYLAYVVIHGLFNGLVFLTDKVFGKTEMHIKEPEMSEPEPPLKRIDTIDSFFNSKFTRQQFEEAQSFLSQEEYMQYYREAEESGFPEEYLSKRKFREFLFRIGRKDVWYEIC